MKFLLFLFVTNVNAQMVVEESQRHYKVISQVVGYTCPANYYYNPPSKLCYPSPVKEEVNTVEQKIESRLGRELPQKRLNSDAVTVNIYNGTERQLNMPAIDVVGTVGVKRRRSLNKQVIIDALDGEWTEEEKDSEVLNDLVVEE